MKHTLTKLTAAGTTALLSALLFMTNAAADDRIAGVASVCGVSGGGATILSCNSDVKDSGAGYVGVTANGSASKSGETEWWLNWPPGVYGGTASYSGSLASWRMSVVASVNGAGSAYGYIMLRDTLTFSLPSNQAQRIHFELDVSGTSSHTGGPPLGWRPDTHAAASLSLFSGWKTYADLGKSFGLGVPISTLLVADLMVTPTVPTYDIVTILQARVNGYIDTSPSHEAIGGGVFDLGHTAFLRMTLPPGVTVSSASGVFLTQPVPVPGALVLSGSALGPLLLMARMRRRSRRGATHSA